MKKILIINGPNLNMLGMREPSIYGNDTLNDIRDICLNTAQSFNIDVDFRQSNHEGEIIDWIQQSLSDNDIRAIIINAAAYTHTSIAIHDALRLVSVPIIEVHLSDPKVREGFRHISYIEPLAHSVVAGKGAKGYEIAISEVVKII